MARSPKKSAYAEELDQAKRSTAAYELTDVDRLVLQRLLKYPGISSAKIAQSYTNMTTGRVATIRKKPSFLAAYAEMTQTTKEHLEEAALRAARRLREFVNSEDKKVALEAIKIALGPMCKSPDQQPMKRKIIFQTTVSPDGSLLQSVIDEDAAAPGCAE